jgi:hypothetical protein
MCLLGPSLLLMQNILTNFYKGIKVITLSTNFGNIILELDTDKAPITVENFLSYAKNGYYNGTIFPQSH